MSESFSRMPEKDAFKKVEAILDPKVIRLAGDDGAQIGGALRHEGPDDTSYGSQAEKERAENRNDDQSDIQAFSFTRNVPLLVLDSSELALKPTAVYYKYR